MDRYDLVIATSLIVGASLIISIMVHYGLTSGLGSCSNDDCEELCIDYCEENVPEYTHYDETCSSFWDRCHCSCKYNTGWKERLS
jgi:hypothetical protein